VALGLRNAATIGMLNRTPLLDMLDGARVVPLLQPCERPRESRIPLVCTPTTVTFELPSFVIQTGLPL
jgi:hypothetical protein